VLDVLAPTGNLSCPRTTQQEALCGIRGGSGITPVISILKNNIEGRTLPAGFHYL
jgi:ferredoxin-NADP reductase